MAGVAFGRRRRNDNTSQGRLALRSSDPLTNAGLHNWRFVTFATDRSTALLLIAAAVPIAIKCRDHSSLVDSRQAPAYAASATHASPCR